MSNIADSNVVDEGRSREDKVKVGVDFKEGAGINLFVDDSEKYYRVQKKREISDKKKKKEKKRNDLVEEGGSKDLGDVVFGEVDSFSLEPEEEEEEAKSGKDLEEVLGVFGERKEVDEVGIEKGKMDFYKSRNVVEELYDPFKYGVGTREEDYEISPEKIKIKNVSDVEEERRGGRSMLEIAGFVDIEAEKKRKEKKEGLW